MVKPAILLIGGLDPQGCSGLSADLATVQMHGCHGVPLITAMTEQTAKGMASFGAVSPIQFMAQYHNCVADYDIKAIKIGLIPSLAIARCVQHILQQHSVPVVVDPVLGSSSGGVCVDEKTRQILLREVLPFASIITPNLPELNQLVQQAQTIEHAVATLQEYGAESCLIKGGHAEGEFATDHFIGKQDEFYLYQQRYATNVRGTGCVLASALACRLARNEDIRDAVVLAKAYVSRGIRLAEQVGPYQVIHHDVDTVVFEDMPKLCYQATLIGKQFDFPRCPQRLGIYPVVDTSDWVSKLVAEGISTIQLRIKENKSEQREQEICKALIAVANKKTHFFINDYWQQAIEFGAYGVHLGQEDLHDANLEAIKKAGLRLGISTHSYWELARALAINPSYIALGPIYETTSKQMPFAPQGIIQLQEWVKLLQGRYPVVAIGGINHQRLAQLKSTGVSSVAMITAITQAQDYREATRQLVELWQE